MTKPRIDEPVTIRIHLSSDYRLHINHFGADVQASMDKLVKQVKALVQPSYPKDKILVSWSQLESREQITYWPASDIDRFRHERTLKAFVDKVWEQSKWLVYTVTPTNFHLQLDAANRTAKSNVMTPMQYVELLTAGITHIDPYGNMTDRLQKWMWKHGCAVTAQVCHHVLKEHVATRA